MRDLMHTDIIDFNGVIKSEIPGIEGTYDIGRLLSFIEATPEGQALFRGVRNNKGVLRFTTVTGSGSSLQGQTLNIDVVESESLLFYQVDGNGNRIPNDGSGPINPKTGRPFDFKVFQPQLLRTVLHELFHAADPFVGENGPAPENRAIDFANAFLEKYLGAPRRAPAEFDLSDDRMSNAPAAFVEPRELDDGDNLPDPSTFGPGDEEIIGMVPDSSFTVWERIDRFLGSLFGAEDEASQFAGVSAADLEAQGTVSVTADGSVVHDFPLGDGRTVQSTLTITDDASVMRVRILSPAGDVLDEKVGVSIDADVIQAAEVGSIFGATLGRALFDDTAPQIASSAVLGAIGRNLGQIIDNSVYAELSFGESFEAAFNDFGIDLASAGAGAVSAFLIGEFVSLVGLDGIGGDVLQTSAGQIVTTIADNIIRNVDAFEGISSASLATALGSFAGAKLASEVVGFDTIGGQVGASVGASLGALVAGKVIGNAFGATLSPVLTPFVGAFVGSILGGAIGSLFGGTPRSAADVSFDGETGAFFVSNVWSRKGGSKDAAAGIAQSVADSLNGVVALTGGRLMNGEEVQAGTFGLRKSSFTYRDAPSETMGGSDVDRTFADAGDLVNFGAFAALSGMAIAGGDVFVKRAFYQTLEMAGSGDGFGMETLLGNLTVGQDFSAYRENPAVINALIAAEPDSAFTAGWTITFARAVELGLMKRHAADWFGGFGQWLGERGVASAANVSFDMSGVERGFVFTDAAGFVTGRAGDSIDSAGKDVIAGADGADVITVSAETIADTTGFTLNGAAADGGAHIIDIAAIIDGGAGDDEIHGGDLGNDLFGGAGDDTLVGGRLDDWLFGGEGDDTLRAGETTETAGDGNMLDGGAGNDRLIGGIGSDWLEGGDGADTLYGNAGDDILAGGAGAGDELHGGRGDDQFIFRRGDGADVAFDAGELQFSTGAADAALAGGARTLSGLTAHGLPGVRLEDAAALIASGVVAPEWTGTSAFEDRTGDAGGADTLVLGPGIGLHDISLSRATNADGAPGNDLILRLVDASGAPTGDEIVLRDWYDSLTRVETLQFADGQTIEIGNFQTFTMGSDADEVIIGTNGADFIRGGGGNDFIEALGGGDVAIGDAGNDQIFGGDGEDILLGADDDDDLSGDAGDDFLGGGQGHDMLQGGAGNDTLDGGLGDDVFEIGAGHGFDHVTGGAGIDRIVATAGEVTIGLGSLSGVETISANGIAGVTIQGDQFHNTLDFSDVTLEGILRIDGGGAPDSIVGSAGDDVIAGGAGNDTLDGGLGTDEAVFNGLMADFEIDPVAMTVRDLNAADGDEGTDQLESIERLRFADQTVSLADLQMSIAGLPDLGVSSEFIRLSPLSGVGSNDMDLSAKAFGAGQAPLVTDGAATPALSAPVSAGIEADALQTLRSLHDAGALLAESSGEERDIRARGPDTIGTQMVSRSGIGHATGGESPELARQLELLRQEMARFDGSAFEGTLHHGIHQHDERAHLTIAAPV